jgi:NAD+ diphosphatase
MFDGLAYSHVEMDRTAQSRTDPEWTAARLRRPDTRVIPMWRDRCLLTGGTSIVMTGEQGQAAAAAAGLTALLGIEETTAVFAADLSDLSEGEAVAACGADSTADLRTLAGALPGPVAASAAYARGLLYWNRHSRFCGSCGAPTRSGHAGHIRFCTGPDCGRQLFPRIEPAVIVLVESPEPEPRCLLARHCGAGVDRYALLAGFVEIGEGLEGAVRREVAEEAGVAVGDVAYQGSQGWPFPAGLMVGFFARATDPRIQVDGVELQEARWFARGEVADRILAGPGSGPVDSIGGWLLRSWAGVAPQPERTT